jgi:hypothetical protein
MFILVFAGRGGGGGLFEESRSSTKISWVRGLVEVESTDEPRGADCWDRYRPVARYQIYLVRLQAATRSCSIDRVVVMQVYRDMLIDRSSYVVPRPKPYAFDHFLPPAGRAIDRPRSSTFRSKKDDVIYPTTSL